MKFSWFWPAAYGFPILAGILLVIGRITLRRLPKVRSCLGRLWLTGVALGVCWFGLEIVFYTYVLQPDSINTLANQRWIEKHWGPTNQQGYRDREWSAERFEGKKVIAIFGDSFAAGAGIAERGDRFADVVQATLGPGWEVVLVAKVGWDTGDAIVALRDLPFNPHVVVLSYYLNDIDGSAEKLKVYPPPIIEPPAPILAPWVDNSYLFNFAYWRGYRFANASRLLESYWQFLTRCYASPQIWGAHQGELSMFVQLAREKNARVVAVLFPDLAKVEATAPFTRQVAQYLDTLETETIDLAPKLIGRETKELIVNRVDPHPSVTTHALVGQALADQIVNR